MTEMPRVTGAEVDSAPAFRPLPLTYFNLLTFGGLSHTEFFFIYIRDALSMKTTLTGQEPVWEHTRARSRWPGRSH